MDNQLARTLLNRINESRDKLKGAADQFTPTSALFDAPFFENENETTFLFIRQQLLAAQAAADVASSALYIFLRKQGNETANK